MDTNGSTEKYDLHTIVHIRECVSETFHSKSRKLEKDDAWFTFKSQLIHFVFAQL